MKINFGFFVLFCAFSILGVLFKGIDNNAYASMARCGRTNGVVGSSNYTISIRKYCIDSQKTLTVYGQIKNLKDAKNESLTAAVKTMGGKMVSVPVTKENYIDVKEYRKIADYFEQDGIPYKVNIDISSLPYGRLFVSVGGSWNGYTPYGPGVGNDAFGIDYIAQTNIDSIVTLDEKRGILNINGTTKNVPAGETVTFDVGGGFMAGGPTENGSAIVRADGTFSTTVNVMSMLDQPWLRQLSVVSKVKDVNGDIIQDFDNVETPPIYSCNFVENKTVQRTINYLYEDGSIAAKSTVQKVDFKRITNGQCYRGKLVEGTYTIDDSDWEKSHTFEKVNIPVVEGYTYNKETVDEIIVNANNKDIVENIIYKKNIILKDDKILAQETGGKNGFEAKTTSVWGYAPNTGIKKKQDVNAILTLSYVVLTLISGVAVARRKF